MNAITLKKGREKSILRKHPWIFSGAIQSVTGEPGLGETVTVQDSHGNVLALAAYSPQSQIRARIWTWEPEQEINQDFFRARIEAALALRKDWIDTSETSAYRLVHAESDRLPGLVVDRYGDSLVLQILSAGPERWRDAIVSILVDLLDPACIIERSDVAVRELEGLEERSGMLYGVMPEMPQVIAENGIQYKVDLVAGQKTGFYLDQRDNRQFCRNSCKREKSTQLFCLYRRVHALLAGRRSGIGGLD